MEVYELKKIFEELERRIWEFYPNPLTSISRKALSELTSLPLGTVDYLVATNQVPFIRTGKRNIRFLPLAILHWYKERAGVEYRKPQGKDSNEDS